MKNLIKLILLIFINNSLYCQIELEHSFTDDAYLLEYSNGEENYYYTAGPNLTSVKIYNSDYSLKAKITPTLPSGVDSFSVPLYRDNFGLSKYIFDTDNLLEIVIFIPDNEEVAYQKVIIYNENGKIVKDFGNDNYYIEDEFDFIVFRDVKQNINKLMIYNATQELTHVYKLPSSTLANNEISFTKSAKSYPNPAKNYLNIPVKNSKITSINIYDINGRKISNKKTKIGARRNYMKVNIESLKSGLYFYEIEGRRYKFLKK